MYYIIWIYYIITVSLIIANHLDRILLCIFWQLDNDWTNLKNWKLFKLNWSVYGQFLDLEHNHQITVRDVRVSCPWVLKGLTAINFETVEICIFLIFSPYGSTKYLIQEKHFYALRFALCIFSYKCLNPNYLPILQQGLCILVMFLKALKNWWYVLLLIFTHY